LSFSPKWEGCKWPFLPPRLLDVTRISDKAEFTPQNVQTNEQRQTTVYEVQLTIDNMDGKLKPGMPVDVTFASQASGQ